MFQIPIQMEYEFINRLIDILPRLLLILLSIVILVVIYNLVTHTFKKILFKAAKTKKQKNNVIVFLNLWKYLFIFLLMLIIIFASTGSITGLGISAGLLTAALGWALQRPITGVAAWIMVITKKPFHISDRVIIGDVKGDVIDITLTHIYLNEIGGIVAGEENSGRVIMIPNAVLFEKNVINYTLKDNYVLDQVTFPITFDSNVDQASKIALESAKKVTKPFLKNVEKPYIRTYFVPEGIKMHVRYYVPADDLQLYSSLITKEIHDLVAKSKQVRFAYPHHVIIKK